MVEIIIEEVADELGHCAHCDIVLMEWDDWFLCWDWLVCRPCYEKWMN